MSPDNNWVQQQAKARAREAVLQAVSDFLDENGFSPLVSELAARTGISRASVQRHIDALLAEGRLTKHGRGRTLRLAD